MKKIESQLRLEFVALLYILLFIVTTIVVIYSLDSFAQFIFKISSL